MCACVCACVCVCVFGKKAFLRLDVNVNICNAVRVNVYICGGNVHYICVCGCERVSE